MAEFDTQSAQIYAFDDDAVWKAATLAAQAAVAAAQAEIAARCAELGIPPEFAPGISFGWHGRGENAVAGRRAELRRMAKSRVEAIELEAVTKIERLSLAAQTEVHHSFDWRDGAPAHCLRWTVRKRTGGARPSPGKGEP
jgi:hypothetical protein